MFLRIEAGLVGEVLLATWYVLPACANLDVPEVLRGC